MIKLVGLLRRAAGTTPDAFREHWLHHHAQIARELPGLRRYVVNPVVAMPGGERPPWDGVAELWFDDLAAVEAAMASPQWRAAEADHGFIEHRVIFLCDERQVLP
jgi:uncharacterized protein (TIGR02118 family)